MNINFSKYHGCGNDFILIDNYNLTFPSQNATLIQALCQRQRGIGADGLILLEPSKKASFRMRIFNADGKEAEMCGNGARCLIKFAQDIGYAKPPYTIQTMHSILIASVNAQEISIEMGNPQELEWNKIITVNDSPLTVHWLDTGVPHAVLFVEDLHNPTWMSLAPKIRFHKTFGPKGVNVNFASIQDNFIEIRTYERGVEGETLACGTGATAVALAAAQLKSKKSPITIKTLSGDFLKISFTTNAQFEKVILSGPAQYAFCGTISL